MENQRVHEYGVETGPNGLPIAKIRKINHLVTVGFNGEQYTSLNGRFVMDNGQPDNRDIPEEVEAIVKSIPKPTGFSHQEQTYVKCEFCPEDMPSGEYARHLADKHIRALSQVIPESGVGRTADPAHSKLRPEDLPATVNGYETDAEGYVVMNADGSPRKKGGRPKKAAA